MEAQPVVNAGKQREFFLLPARYVGPIKEIGVGTYGTVASAIDSTDGSKVAIKKLRCVENILDARRILREIKIMKYMTHPHLLGVKDAFHIPIEGKEIGNVYIVTELMTTDLHRILMHPEIPLLDQHIQYIMYQLMSAFLYLHSAKIIHRDIKPSNILVNENCDIKICDFGLSRQLGIEAGELLTEYVVTRHYRAPEIMLCSHFYNEAVDIWSAGCTLAEMLMRSTLFPGKNYIEMIHMIMERCGTPDAETMDWITNPSAREYVENLPKKARIPFKESFHYPNPLAVDLLEKLLEIDPKKRITAAVAVAHPYLSQFRDERLETGATTFIDFSYEKDMSLTMKDFRAMIFEELSCFSQVKKD